MTEPKWVLLKKKLERMCDAFVFENELHYIQKKRKKKKKETKKNILGFWRREEKKLSDLHSVNLNLRLKLWPYPKSRLKARI